MNDKTNIRSLNIEEKFHQLDEELAVAKMCYKIYRNLSITTSQIAKSDMKKVGAYCLSFIRAEMIITGRYLPIQLHKFFDNQSKSIQLLTLIYKCTSTDRAEIMKIYNSIDESHVSSIAKIRHKVSAHIDGDKLPQDQYANIGVSIKDIKQLIAKLENIMQALSISLKINRQSYINDSCVENQQADIFRFAAKGIDLN